MAEYKYVIDIGRESAYSLTTKINCNTQGSVCFHAGKAIQNKEWFCISMYRTGIGYSAIAEYNYLFGGLKTSVICPPQLKKRLKNMVDKYKNEGGRIYD